nr:IclR family transcriptional regulator [Rhodococcus wratislaviensis]
MNGPTLSSVDNALRVIELLTRTPSLRVIDVADHLGVARSTAHRILAAMLARGFVVQDAHKVYRAGPAFERIRQARNPGPQTTKDVIHAYLESLASTVGETCHVAVLEGNGTRFIDSVESHHALRVGTRIGMLLPAHKTSIGLALLAELPMQTLRSIYPRGLSGDARDARQTWEVLDRKLRRVRRAGYALNIGESDAGIAAVGMCLRDPQGRAFAGIAVAVPTPRFERGATPELVAKLTETTLAIRNGLAAYNPITGDHESGSGTATAV